MIVWFDFEAVWWRDAFAKSQVEKWKSLVETYGHLQTILVILWYWKSKMSLSKRVNSFFLYFSVSKCQEDGTVSIVSLHGWHENITFHQQMKDCQTCIDFYWSSVTRQYFPIIPGSVSPGGLVRPNIRSFSYSASGLQHCNTLVSQLTRKVSTSRSCKQFKGWKRTKYNLLFLSVDWRLNTDDNWLFFWAAKIKELFEKNESKAFYAWDKPLDVKRKRVVDDIGLVAEQRIDNAW